MNFENDKAKNKYYEALKKLTPEQKLKKTCDLSDFTKKLFILGLKNRFPDFDDEKIRKLLLERLKKCSNSNY